MDALAELKQRDREILLLNHSIDILRWDQETYMPERAIEERAEQVALLQGMVHDRIVDPRQEELFGALGMSEKTKMGPSGVDDETRGFLREAFRRYSKQVKTPKELVEELAKTQSLAQAEWVRARKASDFKLFKPYLAKLVELLKAYAECQGYAESVYDPLLDEYEPWMTTGELEKILAALRARLVPLVEKIRGSAVDAGAAILTRSFPADKQRAFGLTLLRAMGFDLSRGRLDVSAHPFTTTLGRDDVRLTTRYNERFFPGAVFGAIHEAGHGLYEQGFGASLRGSLLASGASLGIHESQSRLWENLIGRSRAFWTAFFPKLKPLFPEALGDVDADRFYRAVNAVSPSLIRVEADEVTYNLHIILRFTLEKKIFTGELAMDDVPAAWAVESEKLLGVKPDADRDGVLQDVHWSMGAFGYFPTYTLGNLAAAQFFTALKRKHPDVEEEIGQGRLDTVRDWLKEHVHARGSVYPAQDLLAHVTGERLNAGHFIDYLEKKYGELYGV
ncbi:MAG: carboxypeptidase M32 [Spirochaetales bacterium]|nr:carboxypeptidase M32 [Spirochaetales bacterium]